jgi:hypothetical protein
MRGSGFLSISGRIRGPDRLSTPFDPVRLNADSVMQCGAACHTQEEQVDLGPVHCQIELLRGGSSHPCVEIGYKFPRNAAMSLFPPEIPRNEVGWLRLCRVRVNIGGSCTDSPRSDFLQALNWNKEVGVMGILGSSTGANPWGGLQAKK